MKEQDSFRFQWHVFLRKRSSAKPEEQRDWGDLPLWEVSFRPKPSPRFTGTCLVRAETVWGFQTALSSLPEEGGGWVFLFTERGMWRRERLSNLLKVTWQDPTL